MCGAMQNVTSVKPGGRGHHQLLRRLKNGTGEQEMKQTFLLRNEAIRNNAIDAILSLPIDDKSPHEVHVKEPKRSKAQNDRMWPMLNDVSRQVLWHGQRLAPEDWKDLFTALWLKTKKLEQRSAPGIGGGVRTSKMRKASMTELIEIMFWFGSERNVRWSDDSWREYEWSQRKGKAA